MLSSPLSSLHERVTSSTRTRGLIQVQAPAAQPRARLPLRSPRRLPLPLSSTFSGGASRMAHLLLQGQVPRWMTSSGGWTLGEGRQLHLQVCGPCRCGHFPAPAGVGTCLVDLYEQKLRHFCPLP